MHSIERAAADTAEEDVAIYLGFVEAAMRHGATAVAERMLCSDFVEHGVGADRRASDVLASLLARQARFPDAQWTIEQLVGLGGLVLCHVTMTCAQTSGRIVRGSETVIARVRAGRLAECWRVEDGALRSDEGSSRMAT
ncbi:MAG: ester cyclase [bacterium]